MMQKKIDWWDFFGGVFFSFIGIGAVILIFWLDCNYKSFKKADDEIKARGELLIRQEKRIWKLRNEEILK